MFVMDIGELVCGVDSEEEEEEEEVFVEVTDDDDVVVVDDDDDDVRQFSSVIPSIIDLNFFSVCCAEESLEEDKFNSSLEYEAKKEEMKEEEKGR